MGGGGMPLVTIPLRDGAELRVTPEGVKIGERFFALADLQDARQVAPEPETIALRVAGSGLVEFQPARVGDGAVMLEALFRLRPELRPAGFAPGAPPQAPYTAYPPYAMPYPSYPGYPIYPQYPPYPGYMPGSMPPPMPPPPGYPPPQGTPVLPPPPFGMPFAPNPNSMQGEITSVPRDFGQLLGAIFQLYGKRFRSLVLLALCVVLPPALLIGGVQTLGYVASLQYSAPPPSTNISPNKCMPLSSSFSNAFATISTNDLLLAGAIGAIVLLLLGLLGAWQTAAMGLGVRDAVLGRPIAVGASMRGGLRRMLPTLGAQIITGIISGILLLPGYALLVLAFIPLFSINPCASDTQLSHTLALSYAYLISACVALPIGLIINAFFWVRLGFAPYAAATMRLGSGHALAASWRLTRGNWWRTFFVLFLMSLIIGGISGIAGRLFGFIFPPIAYLVAIPAMQLLSAPLLALTYMVLLSDLRLRSEGYASATQDAPSSGGAEQAPPGAEAPLPTSSTPPAEAAQQQQSTPPLG